MSLLCWKKGPEKHEELYAHSSVAANYLRHTYATEGVLSGLCSASNLSCEHPLEAHDKEPRGTENFSCVWSPNLYPNQHTNPYLVLKFFS